MQEMPGIIVWETFFCLWVSPNKRKLTLVYLLKSTEKGITHVLAYHVDDALIMGKGGDKLVAEIGKIVPMKNLGRPTKFLGVEFKYYPGGDLKLHQTSYLKELFDRFPVEKTKQSPTVSFRLNSAGEPLGPNAPYREAVGGLLWAAIMTRPEIMYAVLQLAQFSSNPMTHHWDGIEQVLMYLKGHIDLGISIKRTNDPTKLEYFAATDADWAGGEDRLSFTGNIRYWQNAIIGWSCQKLKTVSLSVLESEIMGASKCARRVRWERWLIEALTGAEPPNPTIILCDNESAIHISETGVRSSRTKHIEINWMYIVEAKSQGWAKLVKIPTKLNPADFLLNPKDHRVLKKH
jgi:hypothetical protein